MNNSAGEETIQITLMVSAPLSVHLQPDHQTVDVDKNAEFQCIVSGSPVEKVTWLHDGKPLTNDNRIEISSDPPRILIKRIQKEDQGMYQCIVSNEWEQLQSTAELQLGDASPELLYHFSEQTLQPVRIYCTTLYDLTEMNILSPLFFSTSNRVQWFR